MTTGFRGVPHGGARIELDGYEAGLLRSMAELVLRLVGEPERHQDELAALVGIGTSTTRPDDPVLARLLPDAYADDPGAAGEFRRYTEDELRRTKRDNARRVIDAIPAQGGVVTLDAQDARVWLKLLTDVRLSLGTRMGIDSEEDLDTMRADPSSDESLAAAVQVYEWLTYLQESLVHAVWKP